MGNEGKNLDSTTTKGSAAAGSSSDLVKTLDGRMVPKSEIADGEVYINQQGKKVRKVVKKVVKTVVKPKSEEQKQVEEMLSNVNAAQAEESPKQVAVEKLPDPVNVAPLNKLPDPINVSAAESPNENAFGTEEFEGAKESLHTETAAKVVAEEQRRNNYQQPAQPKQETLRDRISAKHSFLLKLENNERVGGAGYNSISASGSAGEFSGANSANGNGIFEEAIAPDANVTDLANAVMKENYDYSIGKGASIATGTGRGASAVSGAASNPNGSVLNSPVSNANNKFSQGLAGNLAAAPVIAKPKKAKKKKVYIKPWVIALPLVLIYVVVAFVYFIGKYNFADKSVNVGLYYVNIGAKAKLKYYDGEPFNWRDMAMTYFYGDKNIKEYDLGKINFVEPDEYSGYTIKEDGGICAVWDGEYANADFRPVEVAFKHENQIVKIAVRIYRNKISKLSTYSSIEELKAGELINPVVRGVYTNEVMVEDGINYLSKQLTTDEYNLLFTYNDGARDVGAYLVPNAVTGMFTLPKTIVLPDREVTVDYSAKNRIKIFAVAKNDETIRCDVYQYFNLDATTMVDSEVGRITETTTNNPISEELETNRPVKFRVRLNEGYTLSENGVSCTITPSGSDIESKKIVLTPNKDGVYCLTRDMILGNIKIYVDAGNKYTIDFDGVGEASLTYKDLISSLLGTEEGKIPPQEKENYIFNGWYTEKTGGVQIIDGENNVINGVDGITDVSGRFIATRNIKLYPRFTAQDYTVTLLNNGIRIMRGDSPWESFKSSDTSAQFYFDIVDESVKAINTNFNNVSISNRYEDYFKVWYRIKGTENWTRLTYNGTNNKYYFYNISFDNNIGNLEFKIDGIKYPINVINEDGNKEETKFATVDESGVNIGASYSVPRSADFKFKIDLASGYVKNSQYMVMAKIGDGEFEAVNKVGDFYVIEQSKLWGTLTIKVLGVVREYSVNLEGGEGFSATSAQGEKITTINEKTELRFKISLDEGYQINGTTYKVEVKIGDGNYVVVYGTEDENGDVYYTINADSVTADITIKVSGIEKTE